MKPAEKAAQEIAEKALIVTEAEKYKAAIKEALKLANGRWCEWGQRAESVETILTDVLKLEEGEPSPEPCSIKGCGSTGSSGGQCGHGKKMQRCNDNY